MSPMRNLFLVTSLVLAGLGPTGCNDDGGDRTGDAGSVDDTDAGSTCRVPSGTYEPRYVVVSGSCGEAPSHPVRFDGSAAAPGSGAFGIQTETESMITGCVVTLTQTVRDATGAPISRLFGPSLRAEPGGTIVGAITLTLYDSVGEPACVGEYAATLVPTSATSGA